MEILIGNIDELLEIRQYFPVKILHHAVFYIVLSVKNDRKEALIVLKHGKG